MLRRSFLRILALFSPGWADRLVGRFVSTHAKVVDVEAVQFGSNTMFWLTRDDGTKLHLVAPDAIALDRVLTISELIHGIECDPVLIPHLMGITGNWHMYMEWRVPSGDDFVSHGSLVMQQMESREAGSHRSCTQINEPPRIRDPPAGGGINPAAIGKGVQQPIRKVNCWSVNKRRQTQVVDPAKNQQIAGTPTKVDCGPKSDRQQHVEGELPQRCPNAATIDK